jgi:multiple sugar transport system substrate-binding protein
MEGKHMRIGVVLVVLLCLLAAGCGGGSSSSEGTTSSAAGGPTGAGQMLVIMGFGTGDEIATTRTKLAKQAIAPAKVKNPNGAFNDQQFLTAVASGTTPDLIYLERQKVGTYAAKGALLPVDVCGIDMSQFRKPAVDEVTFDGKRYGVPEFYDNRTLIINDSVTKKAGVTDPSTTDWAKLKEDTKKLTARSGGKLTRIGFDPKLPEFFPLWAKANGVDLVSKDGKTAHLDDPQAIEALKYAVSLINEQGGWGKFKSFRDTWDFFGGENEFTRNQVGAFPMEDWYHNVLAENSPQVKITAKPFTDRNGNPIDWVTGSAWAISRGAKHVKLAFTGLYTANKAADDEIMNVLWKPSGSVFDAAVKTVMKVQDDGFALPASPGGAAVTQAWTNGVNRVLAGQQSAADALKQAQREAQSASDAAS